MTATRAKKKAWAPTVTHIVFHPHLREDALEAVPQEEHSRGRVDDDRCSLLFLQLHRPLHRAYAGLSKRAEKDSMQRHIGSGKVDLLSSHTQLTKTTMSKHRPLLSPDRGQGPSPALNTVSSTPLRPQFCIKRQTTYNLTTSTPARDCSSKKGE